MKKMVRLILRTFVAPPRTLDCKLAANVHLVLQLTRLEARVLRDAERLRERIGGPRLGFGSLPLHHVRRCAALVAVVGEKNAVIREQTVFTSKQFISLQNFKS